MNCSVCNAPNPDTARYCGQCGRGLYYTAPAKTMPEAKLSKDVIILMVLVLWHVVERFLWKLISSITEAMLKHNDYSSTDYIDRIKRVGYIYDGVGVLFTVVNLVIIVLGIVLSRYKLVRILFVVLLGSELLLFVINYILRWLRTSEPFTFFAF